MFTRKNAEDVQSGQLDTVAAIWILASNDERPEVSYRGLRFRLRLPDEVDERQLVARRGELFRLNIPESRLEELKARYREGSRLPSWLRSLPEADRAAAINELTVNDFFRSQFRADADAPRSAIEVVDWGLKHIDRLRSAIIEKKESRLKEWSLKWIPLASTTLAVIALVASTYLQVHASTDQRALKEYELGFRPKVDGYTRLMQGLQRSFEMATKPGDPRLEAAFSEVELAEIQLDPFLKEGVRQEVKDEVQQFVKFCLDVSRPGTVRRAVSEDQVGAYINYRNKLRDTVFAALFR